MEFSFRRSWLKHFRIIVSTHRYKRNRTPTAGNSLSYQGKATSTVRLCDTNTKPNSSYHTTFPHGTPTPPPTRSNKPPSPPTSNQPSATALTPISNLLAPPATFNRHRTALPHAVLIPRCRDTHSAQKHKPRDTRVAPPIPREPPHQQRIRR